MPFSGGIVPLAFGKPIAASVMHRHAVAGVVPAVNSTSASASRARSCAIAISAQSAANPVDDWRRFGANRRLGADQRRSTILLDDSGLAGWRGPLDTPISTASRPT